MILCEGLVSCGSRAGIFVEGVGPGISRLLPRLRPPRLHYALGLLLRRVFAKERVALLGVAPSITARNFWRARTGAADRAAGEERPLP